MRILDAPPPRRSWNCATSPKGWSSPPPRRVVIRTGGRSPSTTRRLRGTARGGLRSSLRRPCGPRPETR
ncbi:hypothetical protein ACN24M_33650 [Streptomyces microflavus]